MGYTRNLFIVLISTFLLVTSASATSNPTECNESHNLEMEMCDQKPIISCPPFVWIKPSESANPNRTGFPTAFPGGPNCGQPVVSFRDEIEIINNCHRIYTRIWTAVDPNNPSLVDTCHQTIKQIDEEDPVFTSFPSDQVIYTNNMASGNIGCTTRVTWSTPRVFDNHLVISLDFVVERNGVEVDLSSGDFFPEGFYQITYTAFDFCGNFSNVSFTVEVLCADCHISCPDDVCVDIGSDTSPQATGVATAFSGNMNCGMLTPTFSDREILGQCVGRMTIERLWTGRFANMPNETFSCTQRIEVKDISAVQLFNCPTDINIPNNFTPVHWADPVAVSSDNANQITLTSNFSPGRIFPVGITTIIYTARDACENEATCSFKVSVLDDANFDDCPNDIEVTCGPDGVATVDWEVPEYTGTCDLCKRGGPITGFIFMGTFQGSNYYCSTGFFTFDQAVIRAQRHGGNLATIDNELENSFLADNIISPTAMIGYNDLASEGDFVWQDGSNSTFTNWFLNQPNNSNNQDVVELMKASGLWNDVENDTKLEFVMEIPCENVIQVSGPQPGEQLPPGTYTVQYEISDGCGFEQFCIFDIIVREGVTLFCQDDIFVRVDTDVQEVAVDWNIPDVSTCCSSCLDPMDCVSIVQTEGPRPGSNFFRQSKTLITYQAQDECGYTATCSFQVLVDIDPLSGKIVNNNPNQATMTESNTEEQDDNNAEEDDHAEETINLSKDEVSPLNTIVISNSEALKLYPNPVSDILNIITPEHKDISSLQIINANGSIVYNNTNKITGHHIMDMTNYTRGLYFMVVRYSDGEQATVRVMKM